MGVLAHDLRAPLAAIMTAAQLMKVREAATADGRNAKALGRLITSGQRMSRMIEQLLDFTRLRVGGGIDVEPKRADLATLVRQVVDELEASYPDCPVRVALPGETTRDLGRRSAEPGALESGRERAVSTAIPPPASASSSTATRPAPSACRCTTWARYRPP